MAELESKISGKKIALFGSYGWGGGEWMRDWEARIQSAGATVVNGEGIIVNGEPDDDIIEELKALGKALVDSQGQVIGINSSKFASEEVEGMGFAIPISDAMPILTSIITENGNNV